MDLQKNENSSDSKLSQVYGKIVLSLENCLLPSEKLSKSPSVADGLDPETECDLRIIGCELIQTAGILLKLPQVAMATGQVLFQRFYFCKSFVRHPMEVTAMGCVCLASKIEEAPRRIRDVINVFHHIRQIRCQKPITPLILDQQYIALKTQVIKAERRILKELGFCVHVKHPHKLIVCYLQVLTFQSNRAVMQMAWNYMNDSLRTDVFLRYSPETVACACIYLTARKLKIVLPKSPRPWFNLFVDADEKDIQDICRKIVQLYKRPKIDPDALEAKIESLRKNYEEEREKVKTAVTLVSGNNTPNSVTSQTKSKSPSPPPTKLRKLDPSPRKNSDHHSPRAKLVGPERDVDREAVKSSSKGDRDAKCAKEEHRGGEARLKGGDASPTAAVGKRSKVERAAAKEERDERAAAKEERESRSKEERGESRASAKDEYREYRSSSKKDRESRSSRRSGDRESRTSRKEHDSRRRKHRDYKTVYSDSEEEYPHSRSNGNYWKKFYSYA